MTDMKPGEDELRVRQLLVKNGVGPDADPEPAVPPKPAERPRDWLDDIFDTNAPTPEPAEDDAEAQPVEETPEPEPDVEEPPPPTKPRKPKATPRRRRRTSRHAPAAPRSAWDNQPPRPRQSLIDAWNAVPYRLKWLYCHLAAAAAGWQIGLVTWATNTAAWYAAGHWTNASAWVLYMFAGLLLALYRIASKWAWLLRLLASIPIASIAVGLLLYGTGYMNLRIPW